MFEHPKFGVAIDKIRTVSLVLRDRFRKQSGFPSSVVFCFSAQVAVHSCGQGWRMRSFYTLSETGSGGEIWKFRFVTHGYCVFHKKIMAGRIPLNLGEKLAHEIGQHTLCGRHGNLV